MPKGKKTTRVSPDDPPPVRDAEQRAGGMAVSDAREDQSAYLTDDGRHFRVLYNPAVHDPRWFVRSFIVGPDGAPVDIRDYPERFSDEAAAWEGARRAAGVAERR